MRIQVNSMEFIYEGKENKSSMAVLTFRYRKDTEPIVDYPCHVNYTSRVSLLINQLLLHYGSKK